MIKHLNDAQKKEYAYYLTLVSSVLNGTEPQLPYENCNLDHIRQISNDTRMDAIFDEAVLMLSKKYSVSDKLLSYVKNNLNHWIYIDTMMKYEIESLLKCFDEGKIYNLPMKGYFLKEDYPNSFERSISDYDILFDINDIDRIKNIFKQNGYKFLQNDDQQYHFVKAPFMYIEMHRSLLKKNDKNYSLLENQLEKAKVRDGYSYSKEMAQEYIKMGFYIGVGGVVTFKNAKKLKEVVENIPLTSIVLETDCPYMAPEPNRGKRNNSAYIRYVAEKIAELKGITYEEVVEQTEKNARDMYRL